MKKVIPVVIVLALFILTGCNTTDVNVKGLLKEYKVIEIEGCEYIVYARLGPSKGYGFMAHKGNCKNPIHIYKQDYLGGER